MTYTGRRPGSLGFINNTVDRHTLDRRPGSLGFINNTVDRHTLVVGLEV